MDSTGGSPGTIRRPAWSISPPVTELRRPGSSSARSAAAHGRHGDRRPWHGWRVARLPEALAAQALFNDLADGELFDGPQDSDEHGGSGTDDGSADTTDAGSGGLGGDFGGDF
jgi:hypothetical protein